MRQLASMLTAILVAAGCRSAPDWQRMPYDTYFSVEPPPKLHDPIVTRFTSDATDFLEGSVTRPIGDVISPSNYVAPEKALDINRFGHVVDSTWFTNRIGRGGYTAAQVARGPDTIAGPAPGPLDVVSGKFEGVTPGFVVRDSEGRRFLVKLDHPAYPELSSGAEMITTKILHAAGYNVPENYLVRFNIADLRLSPEAETSGKYGSSIPLTKDALRAILSNANPYADGSIRGLFSRLIDGRPVGPFSYELTRSTDPNDRIPHDRRRSLRGLGLIFAWVNNTDPRATNTLDVFIESAAHPGKGFVKHYLLDFGDSLGASGTEPKYLAEGYEYLVDLEAMAIGFFSLGISYRYWLPVERSPWRSVGTLEARVFDPGRWREAVPNPAFREADHADEYWAAALVSRFTPELLAAAVDGASYSNPRAREFVLETLLARQDKVMDYGFSKALPLEDLRIRGTTVSMTDLSVAAGLVEASDVRYRYAVTVPGTKEPELCSGTVPRPKIDLGPFLARNGHKPPDYVVIEWEREASGQSSKKLRVFVRLFEGRLLAVALKRDVAH